MTHLDAHLAATYHRLQGRAPAPRPLSEDTQRRVDALAARRAEVAERKDRGLDRLIADLVRL